MKNSIICIFSIAMVAVAIFAYLLFFTSMTDRKEPWSLYVDDDDVADSVYQKLETISKPLPLKGFQLMAKLLSYDHHVRTGHYVITQGENSVACLRKLKNGLQTPVKLAIPSVRTRERLAAEISKKMMMDSIMLLRLLKDSVACEKYGCDTATIMCLFIPNTYEMYWNITPEKFMQRIDREYRAFWTSSNLAKADQAGLTPHEVITLASIIDEETANDREKPDIAGMYLNRLKQGMPLQADPTVKFALQQFQLRRIYNDMLKIDNPYNTYINLGLPPGPIRIASVAAIKAVLDHSRHDYLYMCAKEDFSGTHNFARTYAEHLRNAQKYYQALNQRNIK